MASEQELASITLAVGTHQLTATMAKPAGRVSADALLPLIDQFVDGEIAVRLLSKRLVATKCLVARDAQHAVALNQYLSRRLRFDDCNAWLPTCPMKNDDALCLDSKQMERC